MIASHLLVLAGMLAVSFSPPADAAIVYTDLPDAEEGFFHFPTNDPEFHNRPFDFDGDGRPELTFRTTGYAFFVLPSPHVEVLSLGASGLAVLEAQSLIDAAPLTGTTWSTDIQSIAFGFNDNGDITGGPWLGVGEKYLGFRFTSEGETQYGWMRMHAIGELGALFRDYAYETEPSTPISAGAVPEPSVPALLMMAIAIIGVKRRRLLNERAS